MLTYGPVGAVISFNRTFTNIVHASLCAEITLGTATFFAGGLASGPVGAMAIVMTVPGSGQIEVTFNDNDSGDSCLVPVVFARPEYVPGGRVRLVTTMDQTGLVPVMRAWVDSDPTGPPDLDSSSPWCNADSAGWSIATGNEAYSQGSDMTVNRFGFGP